MLAEALRNKCLSLEKSIFWARYSQNSKHMLIHSQREGGQGRGRGEDGRVAIIYFLHFSLFKLLNINFIHFNFTIPKV